MRARKVNLQILLHCRMYLNSARAHALPCEGDSTAAHRKRARAGCLHFFPQSAGGADAEFRKISPCPKDQLAPLSACGRNSDALERAPEYSAARNLSGILDPRARPSRTCCWRQVFGAPDSGGRQRAQLTADTRAHAALAIPIEFVRECTRTQNCRIEFKMAAVARGC